MRLTEKYTNSSYCPKFVTGAKRKNIYARVKYSRMTKRPNWWHKGGKEERKTRPLRKPKHTPGRSSSCPLLSTVFHFLFCNQPYVTYKRYAGYSTSCPPAAPRVCSLSSPFALPMPPAVLHKTPFPFPYL